MRIAVLGNHTAAHCTEVHLARTLREVMGHEVAQVQENADDPSDSTRIERIVDGHDLLLYIRCWGWEPRLDKAALRRIEARGTTTAGYHLDRFSGLARWAELVEDPETRDPMFDCQWVFTADGEADWARYDVNHVWQLPGVFGPEAIDGRLNPRYAGLEVAFVGSAYTYHPEWPHRKAMVAKLSERYGGRFRVFPAEGQPAIRGEPLNELYASVPVIVGDSCFAQAGARYWSDRPYETFGRGGLLVFPYVERLGDELGLYPSWPIGDWDAMYAAIEALIETDREGRNKVRAPIARTVRAHGTYTQRLEDALDEMGLDR